MIFFCWALRELEYYSVKMISNSFFGTAYICTHDNLFEYLLNINVCENVGYVLQV